MVFPFYFYPCDLTLIIHHVLCLVTELRIVFDAKQDK